MATTIKLKNSVTTTNAPSSLAQGEVAINITDKKVWVGNAATTPIQLLGGGADGNFTNISVSSVATFGAGTVSAPSITTSGDTNTGIYFPAADTIAFTEGGVESMRIDSSGRLGIGVTSPDGLITLPAAASNTPKIRLQSSTSDVDVAISSYADSNGTYAALGANFYLDSAGDEAVFDATKRSSFIRLDARSFGAISFGTATSGTTAERMRIDSSGNVGIGNTNPSAPLDIQSNSGGTGIRVRGRATANAGAIRYFANDNTTQRARIESNDTSFEINSVANLPITINTNDTERMRITSTGNLMVGTSSDLGYKIGIIASTTATPSLYLRSTAASDAGTAQIRLIKNDNTNTSSQIFIQFVIDANNTNSGQINANGASQAAFGSFSDVRLKENIENLPSQLNKIMALRPVEFDYKNGSGHQIGFIAQEMQQVYPDAIGVGEDEMLTVTGWSKTEARLVKAIQELKTELDSVKAELQILKGN